MIYLLTAADTTATLGTEVFINAIISRMESEIHVITFQIVGNASHLWSDHGKQLFCLSPFGYTNNPLNMSTTIANISVIWKTAPFRADCVNGFYKHTASNRDTAEKNRYVGTEAGMKNLFPSFSHHSIFNCTQSLIVQRPPFSCVHLCSIQCNKYLSSAKHMTTCWRYKDEQGTFPELMEVKSIKELVREAYVIQICSLYFFHLTLLFGEVPYLQVCFPFLSSSRNFSLWALKQYIVKCKTQNPPSSFDWKKQKYLLPQNSNLSNQQRIAWHDKTERREGKVARVTHPKQFRSQLNLQAMSWRWSARVNE